MGQTTHEKKPVSNFLSMQCVVFEQTWNLLRFLFHKIISLQEKNGVETISVAISDSSDCNVLTCS